MNTHLITRLHDRIAIKLDMGVQMLISMFNHDGAGHIKFNPLKHQRIATFSGGSNAAKAARLSGPNEPSSIVRPVPVSVSERL